MGRIKKHKHFGDRDPLKQREEREQKLIRENKINNPPIKEGDQEISKRFKKFMLLKQASKTPKRKIEKNKNKNIVKFGKKVTVHDDFDDYLSKKKTNESDRQHLRRVEEVIAKKKTEAEYAKKYGIQIIRDINGEIKMKKDPLISSKKKPKKMSKDEIEKKTPQEEPEENEATFPLIKYKMSAKMKRKLEKEEQIKRDVVKFGEVALEPPTFRLSQKQNQNVTKPGKRNYLFLSNLNLK
ncbi:hypothetical protein PVAND_002015 [Polypedilum vanderplanki]|uniref:Coiled-coil domain-containing protein 137 n=1 Tax=Polypedilum vanderplanki TaxID=319348 RepID=A0A9J6BPP0_POLVA|nr:hypothetical protein PVAND_002015 [Polypedilum vanderplanki]